MLLQGWVFVTPWSVGHPMVMVTVNKYERQTLQNICLAVTFYLWWKNLIWSDFFWGPLPFQMWAKATAEDGSIFACLSLSNQVSWGRVPEYLLPRIRRPLSDSLLCNSHRQWVLRSCWVSTLLRMPRYPPRRRRPGPILLGKMFQESNVPRLKCAKTPNS